jgi:hypothetical protein
MISVVGKKYRGADRGTQGQRFRVCAVCGKRHGPTYGFRRTLAFHGIEGDKATIECIRKLQEPGRGR